MIYQRVDPLPAPFMNRDEAESILEKTQKQAQVRKTAIKTASFICCPFVWGALFIFCSSAACYDLCHKGDCYEDFKRDCFDRDRSGKLICKYSTCDFEPEWQAASPPKDKCSLIQLIFNPCIFCCCYTNENENNYLLPDERRNFLRAKVAVEILDTAQQFITKNNRIPQIPELILQGVGL